MASTSSSPKYNVALIGLGTIGISFAALHLRYGTGTVKVFDPRPDLQLFAESSLPDYLDPSPGAPKLADLQAQGRFVICRSLQEACANADVIQEQGPEKLEFKRNIWQTIEQHAPEKAHLWSSTSGLPASSQNQSMQDQSRLLVVHPFNPPHIMPLIEVVPSTTTAPEEVSFATSYFQQLNSRHRPVVIKKELPGFVGNRLAYILFKEAAFLVKEDIVSVEDLDAIMETSLGPRFAVQGPFKAYHLGGGAAGIRGFLSNLGSTIQNVWDSYEDFKLGTGEDASSWEEKIIKQTEDAYGVPDQAQFTMRDTQLRSVLKTQKTQ
ncbi:hypothetical protein E8E15_001685 [Penicillium rubens]|nr:hypothetical protein E8E15_001685 [Penicillium rubens]